MALVVASLWLASPASARPRSGFFLDAAVGFSAPIAGAHWLDAYYPSPIFGLHLGGEIWLAHRVGLAPELALDGGPLIDQGSGRVTTGRFRFQPGLRVLFGFGAGHAFFLRWLLGGELLAYGTGGRGDVGAVNVGFATEPGVGMQFHVARHAVIGFLLGTPIGVHSFGGPNEVNVDFAASFFVGWRRW